MSRARPSTAPDRTAQVIASVQLVSGSSGIVGGSAPVASFQAADSPFCAAAAASTADPVPMTLHASGPTAPPDRPAAHPDVWNDCRTLAAVRGLRAARRPSAPWEGGRER